MLIDFVPTVSGVSLVEAPGFLKAPGGAPANVTIAVTRLGGKSAFIGKLGDDEFGHMLAGILKQNGVQADGINFDKGARTAFWRSTFEGNGSGKGGRGIALNDPNLRLPLWPSAEEARKQIKSIWDKADVIKVSDVKLEFLTENDKIDDESAMSLWHPNLKLLLGSPLKFHGSVETFHVKTVDTTGAGDSFVGALLTKIVDDQAILEDEARLKEVLRFSCACGAITTTKKGAIPALPTEAEALTLLKGGA
ncbi:hypothetical protein RND71_006404 [Anisodus tanguticus]|uniref:Carbohydrate kinase PfkB domain-containing protein n=1 Tax=Anisodus tanguticus TaxID=243964 RepID=A0AAE1VNL5_9SOLA|nr:hypothetical protein RND71_006404 [Anisodus tanguticus]